jgi:hypothetical protein
MANMPCTLCNGLEFRNIAHFRVWFEFKLPELSKSANKGCQICQLLQQAIYSYQFHWLSSDRVRNIIVTGRSVDGDRRLICGINFVNDQPALQLELFSRPGKSFLSQLNLMI